MKSSEKLVRLALSYEGYLEKASNRDLDHFTKNAGRNNFVLFWRVHTALQGQPWCVAFIVWCAREVGVDAGIIPSIFSCTQLRNWANQRNLWTNLAQASPQRGDCVIFGNASGTPVHIGLVHSTNATTVFTIEGNTSAGNNVVDANGGGVFRKQYAKTNTRILGYFTPLYADEIKESEEEYVIDNMKVLYNGKEVDIKRINKDDFNFIQMQDLRKLGLTVDWDAQKRMPVITNPNR